MTKINLGFVRRMQMLQKAGINSATSWNASKTDKQKLSSLDERVQMIFGFMNKIKTEAGKMVFFIMYDIENDKVRNQISKYLIQEGCLRVQKSIFMAEMERREFEKIARTLREVNEVYNNEDSIMIVPVSPEQLNSMHVIGKNLDVDFILQNKNTLIF